jgi:16S rRNA (cytosine967-C5)-methyltransferase
VVRASWTVITLNKRVDPARLVAFDLLRAVREQDAYANLLLPKLIAERGLHGRDAGLATELGYGTLRAQGTLDEVIDACTDRRVDPPVRDLLRIGAYQALRTRIPSHAAVATTVDLARAAGQERAAGFVNAVMRRIAQSDWTTWTTQLARGGSEQRRLAVQTAHPEWIVSAFADALGGHDVEAALLADDERPRTHLIAWPGAVDRDELAALAGGEPGPWSPYAVRLDGGDPGDLAPIRDGRAAVQDEGSQLCAIAAATAPIEGRDEAWLDLCAGPGGKAALLAALASERGAVLTANELHPHRAELVRKATARWDVDILVGDARELAGQYDRVLLDAPCSGLGALRRRPEARWRRTAHDVDELAVLQTQLLDAALRLVRPGGVVAYVTCSPHVAETQAIVSGRALQDARGLFPGLPDLGEGPTVQLWPHRHGTDAMFFALMRRN